MKWFGVYSMMVIDGLNSWKGKGKIQMEQEWKYQSTEDNTISLHDCVIDRVEMLGDDIILYFDEYGFNVTKDNSLNPTGRHRNTGPAAVILKNGCYHTGIGNRNTTETRLVEGKRIARTLPEILISKESFVQELIEGEILEFEWNQDLRRFTLRMVDGIHFVFFELEFICDKVLFCWNDLPEDAWFQNWAGLDETKKST